MAVFGHVDGKFFNNFDCRIGVEPVLVIAVELWVFDSQLDMKLGITIVSCCRINGRTIERREEETIIVVPKSVSNRFLRHRELTIHAKLDC